MMLLLISQDECTELVGVPESKNTVFGAWPFFCEPPKHRFVGSIVIMGTLTGGTVLRVWTAATGRRVHFLVIRSAEVLTVAKRVAQFIKDGKDIPTPLDVWVSQLFDFLDRET